MSDRRRSLTSSRFAPFRDSLGWAIQLKKPSEYAVPEKLETVLDGNAALKATFEALTPPGRRKSYIFHISTAKQAKTREARSKTMCAHDPERTGIQRATKLGGRIFQGRLRCKAAADPRSQSQGLGHPRTRHTQIYARKRSQPFRVYPIGGMLTRLFIPLPGGPERYGRSIWRDQGFGGKIGSFPLSWPIGRACLTMQHPLGNQWIPRVGIPAPRKSS